MSALGGFRRSGLAFAWRSADCRMLVADILSDATARVEVAEKSTYSASARVAQWRLSNECDGRVRPGSGRCSPRHVFYCPGATSRKSRLVLDVLDKCLCLAVRSKPPDRVASGGSETLAWHVPPDRFRIYLRTQRLQICPRSSCLLGAKCERIRRAR